MTPRARISFQSPDRPAPVLLVSPCGDDHDVLPGILEHPHWEWHRTKSCRQALRVLSNHAIAVLICERDLPDGSWWNLLDAAMKLSAPPNLIVCSRLADDWLWAEVLNLGGYDLLIKPFDREEVSRVVFLAWDSWKRRRERDAASRPAETAIAAGAAWASVA